MQTTDLYIVRSLGHFDQGITVNVLSGVLKLLLGRWGGGGEIGRGCIMALSRDFKSLVEQVLCSLGVV